MKKVFSKIFGKLLKKAINKSVNDVVSNPEVTAMLEVDLDKVPDVTVKTKSPWWVIVLKVLAYVIGIILGGVVTTSCASHIF